MLVVAWAKATSKPECGPGARGAGCRRGARRSCSSGEPGRGLRAETAVSAVPLPGPARLRSPVAAHDVLVECPLAHRGPDAGVMLAVRAPSGRGRAIQGASRTRRPMRARTGPVDGRAWPGRNAARRAAVARPASPASRCPGRAELLPEGPQLAGQLLARHGPLVVVQAAQPGVTSLSRWLGVTQRPRRCGQSAGSGNSKCWTRTTRTTSSR